MNKYIGHRVLEYFKYRRRITPHRSIHSPFVFDFYNKVILPKHRDSDIESIRRRLLKDSRSIEVEDLGAGSVENSQKIRRIKDIAKTAVKESKYASILYKLVKHYKPSSIVELGTSLGITSLYLQSATSKPIYTLEGSKSVLDIAKKNFKQSNSIIPYSILGNFDDTFPPLLKEIEKPFMIYIDGNHTYDATLSYFRDIKKYADQDCFIVFDDIYWSKGMTEAWKEIIADKLVDLSIDLYQLGIVFFNSDIKEKQNFSLSL